MDFVWGFVFLRCCVNAALYTLQVEINTAGHCQHMMFLPEVCSLSQRGRQHRAKWANITRPDLDFHVNVISKCRINVRMWWLCSRLIRPKSEDMWVETIEVRTDEFCSCVARNEAGASLRCYFFSLRLFMATVELETFWRNVFYCFSLFRLMMLLL